MAKSQEDGITILLGLKDYKEEQVREDEDRVVVKVILGLREKKCPYCGFTSLYRHGKYKPRELLTGATVIEIRDGEVAVVKRTDEISNVVTIRAENIVNALGRKSVVPEEIISRAEQMGKMVYQIGDAKSVRKASDAISEGFMVALDIQAISERYS